MLPIVLVHGGGFDRRCWDLLVPLLDAPVLAVDLPGRGAHPAPLRDVTISSCAASVVDDVDAAGFEHLVLVGHSLAGCTMPAAIGLLGERVRHAVFIACTVPDDGCSAIDMLEPELQAMVRDAAPSDEDPQPMDAAVAEIVLGTDLTDAQLAWCTERLVPEAAGVPNEPVDLSALRASSCGRTWVRTLRDIPVPADRQLHYASNVGGCEVLDLDAGHMCMVSRPEALAEILDRIALTAG